MDNSSIHGRTRKAILVAIVIFLLSSSPSFSDSVSTLEFKLRAYDAIILTDTSAAAFVKLSVFIIIAAALRNFF